MKKEIIIAVLAGILVGIFVTPLFSGMWGGGWMMSGGFGRNFSYGPGMMGNIDQHFIEQMIPHHDGAIAMAEVALEKSKRPEIISLANGIIEAQTTEINQMKEWYEDWFEKQVPVTSQNIGMMGGNSMVHMGGMMSFSGDLETLAAAKDFDLEFIRQMIPHHEMAIMMAQMLQATTDRKEMKELADQIITSQSREITMMESWYRAWSK
ncbi:MAG: DUF305 domain-containing protein [Anaplasmataceae bacterium]|nr:DUF305 domain-containing protein [Anaplasmataceae bacterium]